jgi:hypothetical protein
MEKFIVECRLVYEDLKDIPQNRNLENKRMDHFNKTFESSYSNLKRCPLNQTTCMFCKILTQRATYECNVFNPFPA